MATINPPVYRNIGATQQVFWDLSTATTADVQGYAASFAAPDGTSESFDVTLAGGSPIHVLPSAGDTSAAAIASRINGTAGLSGVASAANGCVKLSHPTSIQVTNMSPSLFPKIGIPNFVRDRALTNTSSIWVPVEMFGTERELIAKPVTVPAGANRLSLTVTLTNASQENMGVEFAVGWGNGIVGETITSFSDLPMQATLAGTVANSNTDQAFGHQEAFAGVIRLIGSAPATSLTRLFELTVPSGASKFYLVPLMARSQSDASTPPRPRTPPQISATAAFAAR